MNPQESADLDVALEVAGKLQDMMRSKGWETFKEYMAVKQHEAVNELLKGESADARAKANAINEIMAWPAKWIEDANKGKIFREEQNDQTAPA